MQITNPSSQTAATGDTQSLRGRDGGGSPAQILDRLNLNDGDTRLARILVRLEAAGGGTPQPAQTGTQAGTTRALLEIAGQQLSVQADSRIPAGELIRVMRAGNALQLTELPQQPQRSALSQALAQKLPFQHNLADGARQLLNTAQQSSQAPVRDALQQVLNLIPTQQSLAPAATTTAPGGTDSAVLERVRQWISESGHFAEPRLATAARSPEQSVPTDLKQALIRAAATLLQQNADSRPAPPDLARQFSQITPAVSPELVQSAQLQFPATGTASQATSASAEPMSVGETLRLLAGMLNRISVNQLHSQLLSTAGGADGAQANQTTTILELPWLTHQGDARLAQLRIEQREGDASEGEDDDRAREQEWRLSLALELDGLGPVYFDLNLKQRALKARVWAESENTARLVEATSHQLADRLRALDLEVPPIECHLGKPVQLKTRLSQHLVDERA